MKKNLVTFIASMSLAGAMAQTFNPVPLTPGSFAYDIVVEKAAATFGAGTNLYGITATVGSGTSRGDNTFFEQGFRGSATNGLPPHGTTFTNVSNASITYVMPPSYTANDVLMIDSAHPSGSLSFAATTATNLSIAGTGGGGWTTNSYTVYHVDGSTESGTLILGDWFNNTPIAWYCAGRVSTNGTYDTQTSITSSGNPRLYYQNIAVSGASAITNVTFTRSGIWTSHANIFAVSGSALGGVWTPITINPNSFNLHVVIPASFPYNGSPGMVTATMDTGTNLAYNANANTFFEQGYYTVNTNYGLPPSGSIFKSFSNTNHNYQMASYAGNNAILINASVTTANITPLNPTNYNAFAVLCAGGNVGTGKSNILNCIMQHLDGTAETNQFYAYDWYDTTAAIQNRIGWKPNGRVNLANRTVDGGSIGNTNAAKLFETYFLLQNVVSPVTNMLLQAVTTQAGSSAWIMAVSATAGSFAPAFTGLTPSQTVVLGTSSVTLSGTVTAGGGAIYPANGESVIVTINGVSQTAAIYDDFGDFTINYTSIPAVTNVYAITYVYPGDFQLVGVTNTSTTLTVQYAPAATPTFSPVAGSYYGSQTVTISSTTPNSTIFYTTDGSTPTTSSSSGTAGSSSATVNVASSMTIKAIATSPGYSAGVVASAVYVILVPASSVWTNLLGGSWVNASNWFPNQFASGTDQTADFSTLTLTANTTVTLDSSNVIGTMLFDDRASANKHAWFLNPGSGGSLALQTSSGTPVISNNVPTTISVPLTGANGLTKSGNGPLVLTSTGNNYTGGTTIASGALQIGDGTGNGSIGTDLYTINGGTTLYLNYATAVRAGAGTWSANLQGGGTLRLNSAQLIAGTADWGPNLAAGTPFNAAFTGTLQIDNGRFDSPASGLGGISNIIISTNGAQFMCWSGTFTMPISISGQGGWGENGYPDALRLAASSTAEWSGLITLTADSGIMAQADSTFTISGSITGGYQCDFHSGSITGDNGTNIIAPAQPVQNSYGSTQISASGSTGGAIVAGNQYAFSTGGLLMTVNGKLQLNGYNFSFANLSGTAGTIGNNSPSSPSVITIGSDNTSTSYGGTLADGDAASLALTKVGAGTLALSGANTCTGPTTVSNGTLFVSGSLASGTVTAANSATLGGTGTIGGAVAINSGGTLAAGTTSLDALTINNNLLLNGNVVFNISKNPTTTQNQVLGTSSVTYGGTLTVVNLGGSPLANGDTFQLFPSGSYSGSFTSSNLPVLSAGLGWDLSGLMSNGSIQVVGTALTPPVLLGGAVLGGNQFRLTFSGPSGQAFRVLGTNLLTAPLATWPFLKIGTFGAGGPTTTNFIDTSATNSRMFYRIVSP